MRPLLHLVISGLQVAALVLFSVLAPLAHLHQDLTAYPNRHDDGEHAPHRVTTFHAHLDGHAHESHDRHHQSEGEEDAVGISHGKLDSPRQPWSPEPSPTLASWIEDTPPLLKACDVLSDPSQDAHGPPVPFSKPVRAPPLFS